jgi:hypothetical protein
MYVTISQEISRQHREEIMHVVKLARLAGMARPNHEGRSRPVQDLNWELARYAGLLSKRVAT